MPFVVWERMVETPSLDLRSLSSGARREDANKKHANATPSAVNRANAPPQVRAPAKNKTVRPRNNPKIELL